MAAARRERSRTRQAAVWDRDLPGGSWARGPVAPAGAQAAVQCVAASRPRSPSNPVDPASPPEAPSRATHRRDDSAEKSPRARARDPCLTEARASAARAPASYEACGRGRPRPTPKHDSAESGVPPSPVAPARAPRRPTPRHLQSAPGVAPGHHPRIAAHDPRIATTGRGASPREAPRRPRRRMRACGRARTGSLHRIALGAPEAIAHRRDVAGLVVSRALMTPGAPVEMASAAHRRERCFVRTQRAPRAVSGRGARAAASVAPCGVAECTMMLVRPLALERVLVRRARPRIRRFGLKRADDLDQPLV